MKQAAEIIGTGFATRDFIGTGISIGVVLGGLVLLVAINRPPRGELSSYAILGFAALFVLVLSLFVVIYGTDDTIFPGFEMGVTTSIDVLGYLKTWIITFLSDTEILITTEIEVTTGPAGPNTGVTTEISGGPSNTKSKL